MSAAGNGLVTNPDGTSNPLLNPGESTPSWTVTGVPPILQGPLDGAGGASPGETYGPPAPPQYQTNLGTTYPPTDPTYGTPSNPTIPGNAAPYTAPGGSLSPTFGTPGQNQGNGPVPGGTGGGSTGGGWQAEAAEVGVRAALILVGIVLIFSGFYVAGQRSGSLLRRVGVR